MPAKTKKDFSSTKMYQGARPPVKKGVKGADPNPTPRYRSKVGGGSGTGMGRGFGSGHAGHRRKGGPHPHAPKNG